jgi:AcrR family transcriptional regulator
VTQRAASDRRLTARGEERRAQLLDLATSRFARDGYHATSVSDIVNGLGVGKGVFYWYFDSKEQLFLEILKSAQRDLRRSEHHAIDGVVWTLEHTELRRLVDFARTESAFAPAVRAGQRALAQDAVAHLEAAMARGSIPDGDARALAFGLLGVTTTMTDALVEEGRHDPEEVADLVVSFCLRGIGARPDCTQSD